MRKSLVRSVIAAATIAVGLSASAASVSAATPPAPPGDEIDINALMEVLTPTQMACLATNSVGVNTDDFAAVLGVLETCDIDLATVMGAMGGSTDIAAVGPTLADFGIDEMAEICITASVAIAPPADDAAALALLQECNVSLAEVVTLIGGGTVGAGTTPVTPTMPVASGSDNPLVASVAAELGKQFPKLDSAQLTCLATAALEDMSVFSSDDPTALFALLEDCGIPLTALI